ncbi:uncharacterized protein LOC117122201 [Anneissia japonica]|uniref:uncharacterized protein LOC117122201 n=1 Tax=Anneissia japonica TaxID=1529436 RepID=UPI0014259685|nr:uncharacterized protein LOC117122201 [Anneissia japonica]
MALIRFLIYQCIFLSCCLLLTCHAKAIQKERTRRAEDTEIREDEFPWPNFDFTGASWSSYEKWTADWNDQMELYEEPGEIIPGFTFTDALNMLGKMYNSPDLRHVMDVFCSDAGRQVHRFLGMDGEMVRLVCLTIKDAVSKDMPIEGVDLVCEMLVGGLSNDYSIDYGHSSYHERKKRSHPGDRVSGGMPTVGYGSWGDMGYRSDHEDAYYNGESHYPDIENPIAEALGLNSSNINITCHDAWNVITEETQPATSVFDDIVVEYFHYFANWVWNGCVAHHMNATCHGDMCYSELHGFFNRGHNLREAGDVSRQVMLAMEFLTHKFGHFDEWIADSEWSADWEWTADWDVEINAGNTVSPSPSVTFPDGSWNDLGLSSNYDYGTETEIHHGIGSVVVNVFAYLAGFNATDQLCDHVVGYPTIEGNDNVTNLIEEILVPQFYRVLNDSLYCSGLLRRAITNMNDTYSQELCKIIHDSFATEQTPSPMMSGFNGNWSSEEGVPEFVWGGTSFFDSLPHVPLEVWVPLLGQMYYSHSIFEAVQNACNYFPTYMVEKRLASMCRSIQGDEFDAFMNTCHSFGFEWWEPEFLDYFFSDFDPGEWLFESDYWGHYNHWEHYGPWGHHGHHNQSHNYSYMQHGSHYDYWGHNGYWGHENHSYSYMPHGSHYDSWGHHGHHNQSHNYSYMQHGSHYDYWRHNGYWGHENHSYSYMQHGSHYDSWGHHGYWGHQNHTYSYMEYGSHYDPWGHHGYWGHQNHTYSYMQNGSYYWGSTWHDSWTYGPWEPWYYYGEDRNEIVLHQIYNDFEYAFQSVSHVYNTYDSSDVCYYFEDILQWDNQDIGFTFKDVLERFFENMMYTRASDCVEYMNFIDCEDCEEPTHQPSPSEAHSEDGEMLDVLEYVRVAFTFLSRYDDSYQFCSVVVNATGYYSSSYSDAGNGSLRVDTIERMVRTFYDILYDARICEDFIEAFEEADYPLYLEEWTGISDPGALCEMVATAMNPTLSPLDYSEAVFADTDSMSSFGLEFLFLNYLNFKQILGIFGVMKRDELASESMNALCSYLVPGFQYMDDNKLPALCEGIREDDMIEFHNACVELVDEFNEGRQHHYDYDGYHEHDYYHYEQDIPDEILRDFVNALWVIDVNYESPYDICGFVSDTMEWDYTEAASAITNVLHQFFINVMYSRNSDCYDHIMDEDCVGCGYSILTTLGPQFEDEGEGDGEIDNGDDAEIPVLDYLKEAFVFLGNFRDSYKMCSAVINATSWNYDLLWHQSGELQNDLAARFTDTLYNIFHDASLCERFVAHFDLQGLRLPVEELTGYAPSDACRRLAEAMDVTTANVQFDYPEFPSELPSSFDLDENILQGSVFLPYVTFDQFIGIIGEIKRQDNGLGVYNIICSHLEPALRLLNVNGIDMICDAIEDGDLQSTEDKCIQTLVPLYYGEDFPVGLRPLDFDDLLEDLMTVVGYDEDLDVCPNVDHIINGDKSPKVMITEAIDVALRNVWGVIIGVCQSWDEIINMISPESSFFARPHSWTNYDYAVGNELHAVSLITEGDNIIGILTGFGNIAGTCDAILEAEDQGNLAVHDLQVLLRERGLGLISNVERCKLFVSSAFDILTDFFTDSSSSSYMRYSWMSWYKEEHNFEPTFEYITGFEDYSGFCEALVTAMTQEPVEICRGLVDCTGVCNGDAQFDCAGICNGQAVVDCAGECNGAATTNQCGECVEGRTRRSQNFGMDKCGMCRKRIGYIEMWDCAGTCNGTAYLDRCGDCVGGESGESISKNRHRLDCNEVCDGDWIEDSCGLCGPPPRAGVTYPGGSKYMDCSLTCITPGMSIAFENKCGECVGGQTGLEGNHGFNECGQCVSASYADTSSCEGCDGVLNSGKEYDTCGVCGGDGTDCVGIGNVFPNFIPANQDISLQVEGAGFTTGSALSCIFTSSVGRTFNGEVTEHSSMTSLNCTANLDAGSYTVQIRRDSDTPTDISANLKVYEDVTIESISPLSVVIDPGADQEVSVVATVQSGNDLAAIRAESNENYDVNPSILLTWVDGTRTVLPGVFTSDTQITITIPVPNYSMRLAAVASVNGVQGLATASGDPFTLTAYYPAPQLEQIQLTSNDDLLTLKEGALRSFRQEFSLAANGSATISAPVWALRPKAILSGSERIPSCGNIDMDGRKSTGSGARALLFQWSVSSIGNTTNIDAELSRLNSVDSGSPELSINGSLIDANTDYIFQLTVTNFLGQSDSTYLSVYRSSILAPQVQVFADGADIEGVKVSESFHLSTLVTYYSACVPPGETSFEWSTNNTDVAMNIKTMFTRSLHVSSKSLPGGEDIQFTVKVYRSSDPTSFVLTSILVTTVKSDLVARIKGGDEFTVGRASGNVQLDGSLSFDPDEEARDWVYEWQCLQVDDNSACWSFDPDNIGNLVVDSSNSGSQILEFDALALEADKTYKFTLIVSKELRSASAVVSIAVVNGDPPKVEVQPVSDTGKVSDNENIFISAFISHSVTAEITDATWIATDTDSGYGFVDLEDSRNLALPPQLFRFLPGFTVSLLGIRKGVLERGTEYSLSATVFQEDGQESSAKMSFGVLSGPTSCDFSINDYEELTETEIRTENCVTSDNAYPLSYQLFVVNKEGNTEAVTETRSDPTFSIPGKSKIEGSDTRDYAIKVCDTNFMCTTYFDSAIVTHNELSAEEENEFKHEHVTTLIYSGDYLGALVNFNELLFFKAADSPERRRRDIVETSSDDVTEQLQLISLEIDNSVLTTSSALTLLDQANLVRIADMSLSDRNEYISYIATIVQVFIDDGTAIPTSTSQSTLQRLTEIRSNLDPTFNANMLTSIGSLQDTLLSSQAVDLVLGEEPQVMSTSDVTTSIAKAILGGTFTTSSSATAATVNFGSQLESIYGGAWSCNSETCSGVTVIFLNYADDVDYLSTTDDDKNTRASSIINIKLADPNSGEEIEISDLTDPITMTIPLTNAQADVTYVCRYWNTTHGVWSDDSMATGSVSSTDVQCQSYHLTNFAVFAVPIEGDNDLTSGTPVIEVEKEEEGLLMYLLIFGGIAVLLLLVIVILVIVLHKKPKKSLEEEDGSRKTKNHAPQPAPAPQQASAPPAAETADQPQQQAPQIHTVLQPIYIQQPYPYTTQPFNQTPVIPGNQPAVTLVSPNGELKSSTLPDYTASSAGQNQSGNYSSYVQAYTGGMAPVMESSIPLPPAYTPPSVGTSGSTSTISGRKVTITDHC